jgi:hypothetical protein
LFPASQGHEPRQQAVTVHALPSVRGMLSACPQHFVGRRTSSVRPKLITTSGTEHATVSGKGVAIATSTLATLKRGKLLLIPRPTCVPRRSRALASFQPPKYLALLIPDTRVVIGTPTPRCGVCLSVAPQLPSPGQPGLPQTRRKRRASFSSQTPAFQPKSPAKAGHRHQSNPHSLFPEAVPTATRRESCSGFAHTRQSSRFAIHTSGTTG